MRWCATRCAGSDTAGITSAYSQSHKFNENLYSPKFVSKYATTQIEENQQKVQFTLNMLNLNVDTLALLTTHLEGGTKSDVGKHLQYLPYWF